MRMDQPYHLIEKDGAQEAPTVGAEYPDVMGRNSGTVDSNLSSVYDDSSDSPCIAHPVASVFHVQCKDHYKYLEAKNKNVDNDTCSRCSSVCSHGDEDRVFDEIVEKVDDSLSLLMKGKKRLQSFFQKFTLFGTESSELKECSPPCTSNVAYHSTTTDKYSTSDIDFLYNKSKLTCPFMQPNDHHILCVSVEDISKDFPEQNNDHAIKHSRSFEKHIHRLKESPKKSANRLPHQMSLSGDGRLKENKRQYSELKTDKDSQISHRIRSHKMLVDGANDLKTPETFPDRALCSASGKKETVECVPKNIEQPLADSQCELCCQKVHIIDLPGIKEVPEVKVKVKKGKHRHPCECHKQSCKLLESESQPPGRNRRGKVTPDSGQLSKNEVSPLTDHLIKPKSASDAENPVIKCNDDMVCLDLPLTNFGFYSGEVLILM